MSLTKNPAMIVPSIDLEPIKAESAEVEMIKKFICTQADLPLERARALAAAAYTSEDYFDWEKENILKPQWLSVAHVSQLPTIGDFINLDLLGEPLSVIRGSDEKIRVLSRVCAHRGMDIMPPQSGHPASGNCQQYRCPYHHWVYGTDGRLRGAPFMKDHPEVVDGTIKLHEFNSAIWQGFIFVNLSPVNAHEKLKPPAKQFEGLDKFLGRWNMAELEMVADIEWDCDFNWKVLVENFMEPYHHVGAHHTTFQPSLPGQHCWTETEADYYCVCHLPLEKRLQEKVKQGEPQLIDFLPIEGLQEDDFLEWSVHLAAPTCLFFVAADRVYWYRLQPLSAGKMILRTTLLLNRKSKQDPAYQQTLDEQVNLIRKFHLEDVEMCTAVQNGLRSDVYTPGPLNKLEEPIWQFQRYLARQIKASEKNV